MYEAEMNQVINTNKRQVLSTRSKGIGNSITCELLLDLFAMILRIHMSQIDACAKARESGK